MPGILRTFLLAASLCAASLLAAGGPSPAQPAAAPAIDAVAAVERVFRAPIIDPDWFSDEFLRQVPVTQIQQIVGEFVRDYGPLASVTGTGEALVVHLARADLQTVAVLEPDGRISGLLIRAVVPTGGAVADYVAQIARLPGATSVLVMTDGVVVAERNADLPLGVGSAAKLAILRALDLAVGEGRLAWDQVVPLDPSWTSLPSGILHFWPAQTPMTIATLANLMMSMSDNTATDGLIDIVGRTAIEAISPRNAPFLKTNELFRMKAEVNSGLLADYAAADEAGKRAVLERVAAVPLPPIGDIADRVTPEAEWYVTAHELCTLLDEVADLSAMTMNPGLARIGDWDHIAYKGGSEPGVLNFSMRLVGKDGRVHCVVATWNNARPVDDDRLIPPFRGILAKLLQE